MTDKSLTDITLVIDRSGSMEAMREAAQSGVNSLIREQAGAEGRASLTLVQFDTEYEFVHQGVAVESVPEFTLVPRGATALLDAVGRAITEVGDRLASLPEKRRPGLVVFVIVTDGMENSSTTFTRQRVREMITHQRDVYKWRFVFLGADDSAFDEARAMGIDRDHAAVYSSSHAEAAYDVMSQKLSRARRDSLASRAVVFEFSVEEREDLQSAKKH